VSGDETHAVEVRAPRLDLHPMPPLAASMLPDDRLGAAGLIGAVLDEAWPLADLLEILPTQAMSVDATYGVWTMIERATNTVVGDIGFHRPPDDGGTVEIGYSVIPSRRRRGYAGEAARALVDWVRAQPGVTSIVAGTVPGNEPSERTLERLGFERTGLEHGECRWRLEWPPVPE
jgi:[ribosomal protein S5]-alanine N-acetyltransferase